ncbi:glycosyltransferase [Liquorilactobacillus mali]|uniref:Glycosyl transferase family 2 n=2 Tax=Liquorilactobacillus mali TaxID=1618 RepID=J1F6A1_9LACO|nr:glycosyltransferase family 2 [Liquorilactobacillus mali KCTC 3596 = DSM 20444]KRN11087.1 glycosyl transferase family 2 [Liquorilactobacillus mali KCTC 3596 = DSM 20444]QFQ75581.1 glycosyltransferase [Liquorilactobacillus mali]
MSQMERIKWSQPILTISLLVSNHLDSVQKCMESLLPLLNQIPSELIVVDTVGAARSDGSLQVATEYADLVVPYEWNNDFAAARNAGLKKGRGKWFLFLDDDEWFDDVSELIAFFNNEKEYSKYGSLSYIRRNYHNLEGTNYSKNIETRCVRLTEITEFKSPIHEYLSPIYIPTKATNVFMHHFGYVGKNLDGKLERNESIMREGLESNPYDMHLWAQLVAGMGKNTKKQRDTVFETAQEGLNNFFAEENKIPTNKSDAFTLMCYMIQARMLNDCWQEAIDIKDEYAGEFKLNQYQRCVLDQLIFVTLLSREEFPQAASYLEDYMLNIRWLVTHQSDFVNQSSFYFRNIVNVEMGIKMIMKIFIKAMVEKNYRTVIHFARYVPWKDDFSNTARLLGTILEALFLEDDLKGLQQLHDMLLNDDGQLPDIFGRDIVILKQKDGIEAVQLAAFVARLNSDDAFVLLQRLLIARNNGEFDVLLRTIKKKNVTCTLPNEELFVELVNRGINPAFTIDKVSQEDWYRASLAIVHKMSSKKDEIPVFARRIESAWPKSQRRESLLQMLYHEFIFSAEVLPENIEEQLPFYARSIVSCAQYLYHEELLSGEPSNLLPAETRFGIFLSRALEEQQEGNYSLYFANLRWGLNCYEDSKIIVDHLVKKYQGLETKQKQIVAEMQRLGNQVKAQILDMIRQGKTEGVLSMINQLKELLPEDRDVDRLHVLYKRLL